MDSVDVEVEESKADIVRQLSERIEQLFNVSVSPSQLHRQSSLVEDGSSLSLGGQATFTFRLSSPYSQESVEKAIVFLRAALEESPDFMLERKVFKRKDFEMVRRNSQAIQQQSLAVLDFDRETFEVCMKGGRSNVNSAKQQIEAVISKHDLDPGNFSQGLTVINSSQVRDLYQQPHTSPASPSTGINKAMPYSGGKDSADSPVRDLDNNILDSHGSELTKTYSLSMDVEAEYSSVSDPYSGADLVERGGSTSRGLDKAFTQSLSLVDAVQPGEKEAHKVSPHSSESECSSPSSSSDTECSAPAIDKTTKLYENKLEFAVKLGYSEQDLDRVLQKHGLDCEFNKLLQELIESSTATVEEPEAVESLSPTSNMADFVSSEEFLGVMNKVVKSDDSSSNLRHIVIDGSNVAMSHGKNVFSCRGIKIAVDWFRQRGHEEITVFVPQWRKEASRPDTPITDQEILNELEREGVVVFTPSRRIKGKRVVCYDDRFVLKLAAETEGIVVSNDIYRDLLNENQEYRKVVDERLLMYAFVNDKFMPPEDPLGRRGPTLANFLRKEPTNPPPLPPDCPYGRKCTYGNKCKYHHPERGTQPHRTVTEVLKEQATLKMQERATRGPETGEKGKKSKPKLTRTKSLVPVEPSERGCTGARELVAGVPSLPVALQDPDSDSAIKQGAVNKVLGKTADYLSVHRKKLEEALAKGKALGAGLDPQETASQEHPVPRPTQTSSPRLTDPATLAPTSAFGTRVSSPSLLNVPHMDPQEGGLVSGHLLLAKKLSDEGADSSFFSTESSSNRASPVALAGPAASNLTRQESMPVPRERAHDRRLSLPYAQQQQQRLQSRPFKYRGYEDTSEVSYMSDPSCLPSQLMQDQAYAMSAFGGQCQSFPLTERGVEHGALRHVASYVDQPPTPRTMPADMMHHDRPSLKPQQSLPMNPFFTAPSAAPGRPLATMKRQNSSSDPQLHVTASTDPHYQRWPSGPMAPHPAIMDPHPTHPMYAPHPGRAQAEAQARQNLLRSTSMQPVHHHSPLPFSPSLDRQISEGVYSQPDPYHPHAAGKETPGVYRELEGRYPFQLPVDSGSLYPPGTPTQPGTPTHLSPKFLTARGGTAWPQDLSPMPTSPVRPVSFPKDQPIPATDSRYPLYYNLCGIFAEPRVRAAMNLYPEERNPQKLCGVIMSIQM